MEFKQYRRKQIAELRELEVDETFEVLEAKGISVSTEDKLLPISKFSKGKVARNPKNHKDQWYVADKYFQENFEEIKG